MRGKEKIKISGERKEEDIYKLSVPASGLFIPCAQHRENDTH